MVRHAAESETHVGFEPKEMDEGQIAPESSGMHLQEGKRLAG